MRPRSHQPPSWCRDAVSTFVALILLLASAEGWALPDRPGPAALSPDEAQDGALADLYAVILDRHIVSEAIPAYPRAGGLLLPVGELCRVFEIDAVGESSTGTVRGTTPSGAAFAVDARRALLMLAGRETPLDRERIRFAEDEVFLDQVLLAELLGVDFVANSNEATLTVTAKQPLPVQQRLERERRGEALKNRPGAPPPFPEMKLPYRFLGGPFIDPTFQIRLDRPESGAKTTVQSDYAARVTGDLLWGTFEGYISGTEAGLRDVRGTLGRRDPDARLLGPLHATDVSLGNVFNSGMDLVMSPASGTGVVISSFPLQRSAFFDRTALRGDLPAGWSVELYLNGSLIDFERDGPDGVYEFRDVPVYYGVNVYRLVFYGPSGQKREETRTFSATEALTPRGAFRYRAGALDPAVRVVDALPLDSGQRAWVEGEYGITTALALSAGAARVTSLAGVQEDYATGGLRASLGRVFVRGDAAVSGGGGRAFQAGTQARLGGVGVLAQYSRMTDYATDWFRALGGALRQRAYARVDGTVPRGLLPQIPVSFDVEKADRADGVSVLRANGRISAYARGISASNALTWSRTRVNGTDFDYASGSLLLSRFGARSVVRGSLSYNVSPRSEIGGGSLAVERRLGRSARMSTAVTRTFQDGRTAFQIGLSRGEGLFAFGLQAEYSNRGGLRAAAQISMGIGRDDENRWHASSRQMGGSGALVGRTFLDVDGNGRLDAGDTPIEGARFLINGSHSRDATSARGSVFLPSVASYQETGIALATETLEDPYWKPAREGVVVVPRPGRAPVIDIPVLVTGEITGTVFARRGATPQPIANAKIELVDPSGTVTNTAVSAWDGYFTLTEVRPGKGTLRVSADSLARLGEVRAQPRPVEILANGTVLDGVDLVIVGDSDSAVEATPALVSPPTPTRITSPAEPAPTIAPLIQPAPAAADPSWRGTRSVGADRGSLPAEAPSMARKAAAFFVVQIASMQDRARAETLAAQQESELGRKAFVATVDLAGRGTWHRVLVGEFATRNQAIRWWHSLPPGSRRSTTRPPVHLWDPNEGRTR